MSQSNNKEPSSTLRRSRRLQNLDPLEPQAVPGTSRQTSTKEERSTEVQAEPSTQVEMCLEFTNIKLRVDFIATTSNNDSF